MTSTPLEPDPEHDTEQDGNPESGWGDPTAEPDPAGPGPADLAPDPEHPTPPGTNPDDGHPSQDPDAVGRAD